MAGLLAGLYEFPTSANVSSTISDLREIPHTLLSVLLVSPPQPYVQKGGTRLEEDPGIHCLNIVSVKPAGDIVHIFSHIRKTYRVQWVLMVGGNEPPELCVGGMKAKLGGKKRQVKGVDENGRNMNDDPTAVPLATMWTPLDKVEDAKYVWPDPR
jgi:A/G-specific adenine glycosylase